MVHVSGEGFDHCSSVEKMGGTKLKDEMGFSRKHNFGGDFCWVDFVCVCVCCCLLFGMVLFTLILNGN